MSFYWSGLQCAAVHPLATSLLPVTLNMGYSVLFNFHLIQPVKNVYKNVSLYRNTKVFNRYLIHFPLTTPKTCWPHWYRSPWLFWSTCWQKTLQRCYAENRDGKGPILSIRAAGSAVGSTPFSRRKLTSQLPGRSPLAAPSL